MTKLKNNKEFIQQLKRQIRMLEDDLVFNLDLTPMQRDTTQFMLQNRKEKLKELCSKQEKKLKL